MCTDSHSLTLLKAIRTVVGDNKVESNSTTPSTKDELIAHLNPLAPSNNPFLPFFFFPFSSVSSNSIEWNGMEWMVMEEEKRINSIIIFFPLSLSSNPIHSTFYFTTYSSSQVFFFGEEKKRDRKEESHVKVNV